MKVMKVKVATTTDYPGIEKWDILELNPETGLYEIRKSWSMEKEDIDDDGNVVKEIDYFDSFIGLSQVEVETNIQSKYNPKGVFEYVSTED